MAAGDVVELSSWLNGAVVISGVLDANGLVSEVRRAVSGDVTYSGTVEIDGRPYPIAGAMPVPVPIPQRFAPTDTFLSIQFSGKPN